MLDLSKIAVTHEMITLLGEIDEFKGAWQLFGRLSPERLSALRTVATIESIGSSTRIEGSKLSDREIENLLSDVKEASFTSRDEQEVAGYAYVCEQIFQNYTLMPITENMIKELHQSLLKFSKKDERHLGEYKKITNNIEAFDARGTSLGIIFETASPFETPIKMEELILFVRDSFENKTLHPLLIIGVFIVVFLAIHPFQDGNGRLSRIITTWFLLRSGYVYVPYSSLESIIERNKESYYLALQRTQKTIKSEFRDFTPWLLFFLRSLQSQKIHLEQKISKEKMLMLHLPPLSSEILNLIHEHGRLSIADIEKMTGANRNTLKKTVANLKREGHILRLGKGRSTWYTLS